MDLLQNSVPMLGLSLMDERLRKGDEKQHGEGGMGAKEIGFSPVDSLEATTEVYQQPWYWV